MKVRPPWMATGWRIVGPRGVIQYRCYLPGGARGIVFRRKPGLPWRYQIGGDDTEVYGRFRTPAPAMKACEIALRSALRSALRKLESPR